MPLLSAPDRVAALLAMVLERPPGKRAALLQAVCGDDLPLRNSLEALVETHERLDRVRDSEATTASAKESITLEPAHIPEEAVGQTLGHYRLLEEVGEGGYGVVYVAEQTEPVRRRVALKVIKLGMDTKQVVARFEAERQALAMMDHPNIARILDAGITTTGRPFFVMELVRGIRITDYCDQTDLGTRERLDLFIKVCQAIQHAHQKGIIHRDIKPSNILVTLHDGVPVPKVIDFGIAKATEGRLTDATVYTQLHQFIGTPAYMSPEQAEMSGLDIDTRSDIYSLGVLLYELLTGCTPFDARALMASGIDAMRRTIREEEPVRPSTKLGQTLLADQAPGAEAPASPRSKTARLGGVSPRRRLKLRETIALLRGDLDWIVMKCLEKDRTRRYETANGLAADLKRHLANEPVAARPPSTTYRLQKAIRRNTLAFSAGAVVLVALALGITLSTWQAVRATRAESLAKHRLAESETIHKFLIEVFQSPNPARDGWTITVAEALDAAAKKLEVDLANQPGRQARLQATLGETYYALGLSREAIPLLERARDYHRTTFGPEHPDTLMLLNKLANAYAAAGRRGESLALREEVLTLRRRVLGPEHPDTLIALSNLAVSYDEGGRRSEALRMEEEVVAIRRSLGHPEDPDLLVAMGNLAFSYTSTGRPAKALALREEVLAVTRRVLGPEHPDTLAAMRGVAVSYHDMGRAAEALELREAILPLSRKVLGPEHPDTIGSMDGLAESYEATLRQAEALRLREEVMALSVRVLGPEHPDTIEAMTCLASSLCEAGRPEEGIQLGQSSLALCRRKLGPTHEYTLGAMTKLAVSYRAAARTGDAIALEEESLRLKRESLPAGHPLIADSLENLSACYEQADRRPEAGALRRELAEFKTRAASQPPGRGPDPAPPPRR